MLIIRLTSSQRKSHVAPLLRGIEYRIHSLAGVRIPAGDSLTTLPLEVVTLLWGEKLGGGGGISLPIMVPRLQGHGVCRIRSTSSCDVRD